MPVAHVGGEALRGATEVVVIHRVRADAGVLGPAIGPARALFGGGNDGADGFAAQAAGAEGESAEKAVVEFRPIFRGDQFVEGSDADGGRVLGEEGGEIFGGRREEEAAPGGVLNAINHEDGTLQTGGVQLKRHAAAFTGLRGRLRAAMKMLTPATTSSGMPMSGR